jgi:ATP-binding cassette subfamily F protein uup
MVATMALINFIDISKQYDTKKILCNANFSLNERERVVIVGKNGAGKSTFMKLITGQEICDDGKVVKDLNIDIKMLSQAPKFKANQTVKQAIEEQLVIIKEKKLQFEKLSIQLEQDFENKQLLKEHETISNFLDHHNAWNLDDKLERVMQEFQLKQYENKLVDLLSGGEQRRVALASLLLQKPDVLLLDEPTNHLDVYMVEFLENLLLKESFTLVFISHDRYFIDKIATRTVEIDECKIYNFKGGYTSYLEQKQKLISDMKKSHENLLRLLKREQEWLNKGVRARVKRNEGRKQRVFELKEQAKTNPSLIRKMSLELEREQKNFNQTQSVNKKKVLFDIEDVDIKLGNKELIKNFTTRIFRQDKIAIVGKNGTGKSTLIKALLKKQEYQKGTIKTGENISIGYFDQQKSMLNDDKSLIETFCPLGGDRVEVKGKNMHVFGYLKSFLFPKEYLDKKVGALSGGEKSRVALALLFTKEYDVLILDEPTNDLDIQTINILEEYLLSSNASIILVSHDRYFVDKVAQKLYILGNDDLKVEESLLQYSEYLDIQQNLNELNNFKPQKPKQEKQETTKKQTKFTYKQQTLYNTLEKEIPKLEQEIEQLNKCLQNPQCYQEHGLLNLSNKLEEAKNLYNTKVEDFLELEEIKEEF